ncbi:MAG: hypothetical protein IJ094_08150, partial [Bacilli bacterium]|nr:hypothetical protein [Bacilli bacterium]
DGSNKLNAGATELNGGLGTLKQSQEQFTSGVNSFIYGVSDIRNNYISIDNGINSALNSATQL